MQLGQLPIGPVAAKRLGEAVPRPAKLNPGPRELDLAHSLYDLSPSDSWAQSAVDKVGRDSKLNKTWPHLSKNLQCGWGSHGSTRKPTMPREGFWCTAFETRAALHTSPPDLILPPISPPHDSVSPWSGPTFIQEPSLKGASEGRGPSRF